MGYSGARVAGDWPGARLCRLEKGAAYYLNNHVFWAKMGLFLLMFLLELWPMLTLIRWRRQVRRGAQPETHAARQLARLSVLEAGWWYS